MCRIEDRHPILAEAFPSALWPENRNNNLVVAVMGGQPPDTSSRAAHSRERDLSRSSAPEEAADRRSSRRNSCQSNDAPVSETTLHPASAPGPQRGRAGLPPFAPMPVPTEVPPPDVNVSTPTRILARPLADVDLEAETLNSPVMPASPGGPPPDGDPPDDDGDPDPRDHPDHPGFQKCFRCGELVQWFPSFT